MTFSVKCTLAFQDRRFLAIPVHRRYWKAIVLLTACCAAQATGSIAHADARILQTPAGSRLCVFSEKPAAPAPTLFVFAISIEAMRQDQRYTEAGRLLARDGWLYVTLDPPCHGDDRRRGEPERLQGWASRVKQGQPMMEPFVDRCTDALDYLVDQGYTDPRRVAACGTSRGGFCALHFAAADSRVRAVAAISPVTRLRALHEFEGVSAEQTKALNAAALVRQLIGRSIWLGIGNHDQRVGTDDCLAFARTIIADWHQRDPSAKVIPVEIVVAPSEGHAAIDGAHQLAARFLRHHVPGDFEVFDARDNPGDRSQLCVAALCFRPANFHTAVNTEVLQCMIRTAEARGADLVITPECALNGYAINDVIQQHDTPRKRRMVRKVQQTAEAIDGPRVAKFRELAEELGIFLVLGLYEDAGDAQFNTAVLIGRDGEIIGHHRKIWRGANLLGNDLTVGWENGERPPGYRFGMEEYRVFDMQISPERSVKVGLMICTERENALVTQRLAEAGAELVICPSFGAKGNHRLMSQRSRENNVHTVLVNPYEAVVADRQGNVRLNVLKENVICLQQIPIERLP